VTDLDQIRRMVAAAKMTGALVWNDDEKRQTHVEATATGHPDDVAAVVASAPVWLAELCDEAERLRARVAFLEEALV
jgi:hypothetical protein